MSMKLSVVIPAYNEEKTIAKCVEELRHTLRDKHHLQYEIIVVNDNSTDATQEMVQAEMKCDPAIRMVTRTPPGGFGRAVRSGLEAVQGDIVVIYMADLSDDPEDVVAYYHKLREGYDCVFGSRFIKGSQVANYPRLKLVINRIVNRSIQILFWTRFNDLTNAFKAYRTSVIRECGPYRSSHFNITLEMSLGALIRGYHIAQLPIRWYGRTWGISNLKLRQMGRRYLSTLLMMFFQRVLVRDDLMAERLASNLGHFTQISELERRIESLEKVLDGLSPELPVDELHLRGPHIRRDSSSIVPVKG
jgi:dolichol-phosphate mannosyltransferase